MICPYSSLSFSFLFAGLCVPAISLRQSTTRMKSASEMKQSSPGCKGGIIYVCNGQAGHLTGLSMQSCRHVISSGLSADAENWTWNYWGVDEGLMPQYIILTQRAAELNWLMSLTSQRGMFLACSLWMRELAILHWILQLDKTQQNHMQLKFLVPHHWNKWCRFWLCGSLNASSSRQ